MTSFSLASTLSPTEDVFIHPLPSPRGSGLRDLCGRGRKSIRVRGMGNSKETASSHKLRDCGSTNKTSRSSNQTKFQIWEGEVDTRSQLIGKTTEKGKLKECHHWVYKPHSRAGHQHRTVMFPFVLFGHNVFVFYLFICFCFLFLFCFTLLEKERMWS